MFSEFEKDTEKETPEVLFRTVCVSRVRKSLKRYPKEPPDRYDRGVLFMSSDSDLKK